VQNYPNDSSIRNEILQSKREKANSIREHITETHKIQISRINENFKIPLSLPKPTPTHNPHHARPLVHRNVHAHAFPACIRYSLLHVRVIDNYLAV